MFLKVFGALCIIIGCSGFGMAIASAHKREERILRKLIGALDYMECELQFRMCSLPELFRKTSAENDGILRSIFLELSYEMDKCISADVHSCMDRILANKKEIPLNTLEGLKLLGGCLGRFDLEGQLKGLESVRAECRTKLSALTVNSDVRRRSYQTLGLCAGAALVILLM